MRVGRVLNKYKVGKHFKLDIRDDSFSFVDDTKVTAEAALDGIYVIRTSLAEQRMKTDDTVRSYKLLTQVERAFRSFKSMDLKVRPIRHRRENRVSQSGSCGTSMETSNGCFRSIAIRTLCLLHVRTCTAHEIGFGEPTC